MESVVVPRNAGFARAEYMYFTIQKTKTVCLIRTIPIMQVQTADQYELLLHIVEKPTRKVIAMTMIQAGKLALVPFTSTVLVQSVGKDPSGGLNIANMVANGKSFHVWALPQRGNIPVPFWYLTTTDNKEKAKLSLSNTAFTFTQKLKFLGALISQIV